LLSKLDVDNVLGERSSTSNRKMMMVGDVHLLKRSKDKLKVYTSLITSCIFIIDVWKAL
jgi:hypothetical protein